MAIRINRVYTRSGDDGSTALIGGVRVPKDHPRVASYGCVDELNSAIGLCRAALSSDKLLPRADCHDLEIQLRDIQQRLFDLGSVLATPEGKIWQGMPLPGNAEVTALEQSMDAMQKSLQPLTSFVLPGGSWPNAWLHHCRAQCRRAERAVVALTRQEAMPSEARCYLNRLSDWFFVAARYVAKRAGATEFLWEYPAKKNPPSSADDKDLGGTSSLPKRAAKAKPKRRSQPAP